MELLPEFKLNYKNIIESQPIDGNVLEKYSGTIPYVLGELWKQDGWAGYMNGFIWTINPDDYLEFVLRWIDVPKGTPVIPIMRTAFGDLLVWWEGWVKVIDVRHQELSPLHEDLRKLFENFFTAKTYALEEMRSKYFPKAHKKLGELKSDECYGFTPILALGGSEKTDNLKVVKFKEHLEILTQAFE
nr:T6SS immunity protein Tdi1 domain-containing protein [uncultured Psychroserpens sp.]